MPKLSNTQTILLRSAAARANFSVLPLPEECKVRGAALHRTLTSLLQHGLVAEASTGTPAEVWRNTNANGVSHGMGLTVTPAGLAAVGVEEREQPTPDVAANSPSEDPTAPAEATPTAPRPGGKLGAVIDAIARPDGASLDELSAMAGWLPHTTRAAVTRLRQRGHDVTLRTVAGRKAYCLAGQA